jgi:hypothetical protein
MYLHYDNWRVVALHLNCANYIYYHIRYNKKRKRKKMSKSDKLKQIRQYAYDKMLEWGLIKEGWKFVWDTKARRRYGQCRYHKREIGITKQLAAINSFEETQDTVLHEIAHALAGAGHGHDSHWKHWCIKVGAEPTRCYRSEDQGGTVKTLEGKYKLINKDTGEVYATYHRRPKFKDWSTRWMRGRKAETYGKLKLVANQPTRTDTSPYRLQA